MIRNYIKIAIRNILKHKEYSFINIIGLAGSMAITILIMIYAQSVLTYDQFYNDSDQIYFMYRDRPLENGRLDVNDTWYPLVEVAKQEFPSIEQGTRMVGVGNTWVAKGDVRFEQRLTYADSNYFDVFSFPFIAGDPATALDDPNSIVISKEVADKFFGEEDPIGKNLQFGFNADRVVTGVLDEIPSNSSFQFECIAPLRDEMITAWIGEDHWRGSFCLSFIKLRNDADVDALKGQLNVLMEKYVSEEEQGNFLILPISGYYDLITSGQSIYAHIMLLVALVILLIAIINFANLATAQSLLRKKEVGVRKVLGAKKSSLTAQFLSESLIMSFVALVLGGLMAELFLPKFNELIAMELDIIYTLASIATVLVLVVVIGVLSGFYPALFVSNLRIVNILKTKSMAGKMGVRNLLVGIQFVLAIALMSSVGVIMQQINFMKSHDLNFDQQNVMVIPISLRDFEDPTAAMPRIVSFKNELRNISGVVDVAGSNAVPGNYSRSFSLFLPKGQENITPLDWQTAVVDHAFFSTYGIDIIEGRNFIQGSENDFQHGAIINRAAMDQLGWETIEGNKLLFPRSREEIDILGVVENFNIQSLRNPVAPLVHYYGGDSARNYRYVSVKLYAESRSESLATIAQTWEKMDFGQEYEYYFPDEQFSELYATEESVADVLSYAMYFAILIACLGLYSLASFSVMLKTKEIAIRKVLGASVLRIITSFSKKYLLLVGIAAIPAILLTWFSMKDWLEDFAYRTQIGVDTFLMAILGSLIIAFLTVSYHALKAGITNPVESLKED
ncbi:MAG: ABC transporter permease [Fulvivirga sp.]|uniref:ABC transporter permease n=1 Tax=Fulvivirga sp. TaxID=1931237 RepID=UPI0032EEA9F8